MIKPFRIPTDPVVMSYIAGIFDGEAYIGVTRQKAAKSGGKRRNDFYSLMIQVKATDKRMTDYLLEHVGGYYRTENRRTINGKLVHNWAIDGDRASSLLLAIRPYLVCKRDQADIGIRFRGSFGPIYCKSGTPRSVVEFRHECYERLKEIHGQHSGKARGPVPVRLVS